MTDVTYYDLENLKSELMNEIYNLRNSIKNVYESIGVESRYVNDRIDQLTNQSGDTQQKLLDLVYDVNELVKRIVP